MAVDTTNVEMINLTAEDVRQNQQGTMSEHQHRVLYRHRLQWIAGAIGFVLICGTLAVIVIGKLLAPSFVSWPELLLWLPVSLLWMWLLRASFAHWRHANHDLANGRVAVIEGRVQCEFNFGIGLIRLPRYHILIGERNFSVGKQTFFQFKQQEQYRVFYAPTALILLGAAKLEPTQIPRLHTMNQDQPLSYNETFVANPLHPTMAKEDHAALVEQLTQHERAIVQLIAQGLSNKEIADELSLSTNTIKMYTSQLYRKLGVRRRTEAVARARQLHIL